MFCNNCGKEVKQDVSICKYCGCKVETKLEADNPSAFTYICIMIIFTVILWAVYENIKAFF